MQEKSRQSYEKVDLATIRNDLGMTQQEMADFIGVARTYIAMVESGSKPFSEKMRQKIIQKVSTNSECKPTEVDKMQEKSIDFEERLREMERKLFTIESLLLQIVERLGANR